MGYTTIQGQAWDQIARDVYGNEKYADVLMNANPRHLDTFVFSAGVELSTPVIQANTADTPLWRKSNE